MIKLIFLFFLILFLLSFGASNLDNVAIKVLPSLVVINIPIYLFFYLSVALGVIIGSIYYKFKK